MEEHPKSVERLSTRKMQEITEEYEKAGWEVTWNKTIDDIHQDCHWHQGEYFFADKENDGFAWEVMLGTYGDVSGELCNKEGEPLVDIHRLQPGRDKDIQALKTYIKDDAMLHKAMADGTLSFEDNNWNEMMVFRDGVQLTECNSIVLDEDGVLDAIPNPRQLEEYLANEYGFLRDEDTPQLNAAEQGMKNYLDGVQDGLSFNGHVMKLLEQDDRKMARHVLDALDREKYWLDVRDGQWYSESPSGSKGIPKSHYKFLEKELQKFNLLSRDQSMKKAGSLR